LSLIIKELAKTTLQSKRINLWTTPIVGKYFAKSKINKKLIFTLFLSHNICKYAKKVNVAFCLLFTSSNIIKSLKRKQLSKPGEKLINWRSLLL